MLRIYNWIKEAIIKLYNKFKTLVAEFMGKINLNKLIHRNEYMTKYSKKESERSI